VRLPEQGPWPHPFFETPDETLAVGFRDAEGNERGVATHHEVAGSGPPLVLVHGLMTSAYSWRYVVADLARRYRVFVPDLVGSGASEKPPDLVYSVENLARFLAAYVRALDAGAPYLVGNSLGGLICLRSLLDSPGLARPYVHIHAPGYPMTGAKVAHALLGVPPVRWALAWFVHRFRERFVAWNVHYARDDMLSREEVREYASQFETAQGAKVFVRILRESLDPSEHAKIISALRRDADRLPPVLLLYAREDPLVPPEFGPRYAEDIPGAPLHWVDESSHFVQVEQPERTVTELRAFASD
jgi:pimeloyl-ACP methyl ester carboxylesterase